MAESQDLFSVLMDQLQIDNTDILDVLSQGQLDQVKVLVEQRIWEFHLKFPHRIHPDVYQVFQDRITYAFKDIARVEVFWHFDQDDINDEDLQAYWFAVYSVIGREKPFIKATLANAQFSYADETLSIGLASDSQKEAVVTKYHDLFLLRLRQIGLGQLRIQYYVDDDLYQEEKTAFEKRQASEDESSLIEALEQEERRQASLMEEETLSGVASVGKDIPLDAQVTPIKDLGDSLYKQVIEGYIFKKELKPLRSGETLVIFGVTDYTSSVYMNAFTNRRISLESLDIFQVGEWIRAEGDMIADNYSQELYLRPRSIRPVKKAGRLDNAQEKRVELHAHTHMSTLDATNSVTDLIRAAAKWGMPALAVTDHGSVQSFPEAFQEAKNHDLKMIYGLEADLVLDGEPIAYNVQDIDLVGATFVVFDVETTGLSSIYDKIIELAAVKMEGGQVIDRFESFVNPNQPLSAFTMDLTSISNDMVADAPQIEEVIEQFKDFCQGSILVAHNASFDMGFIQQAFQQAGLTPPDLGVIDTLALSRTVNADFKTHGLARLAKHYGISLDHHHRAVYDAEATGYLLYKLLDQARDQFDMTNHQDLNEQMGQGEAYKQGRPYPMTILVQKQLGLKNLFTLVSKANCDYFYRTPRTPKSLLKTYREGLIFGTGGVDGEVFLAMMQKGYEAAKDLANFYDFIEIQPPQVYAPLIREGTLASMKDLEDILIKLVELGEDLGIPVVATGDVHYLNPEDHIYREVLQRSLKANQNRDLHLPPVHFRTTDEMLADFAFLGEEKAYELVVTNSQKIADSIEPIQVIKEKLYTPTIEGADQEITEMTYAKAHALYGQDLPDIVSQRVQKELDSIISNGFSVIYLISQKLVEKSNQDGYLVGSRGSVGSSLVAGFIGITEVNPLAPHYYCPHCHYSEFFTEGEVGSGYDLPEKACPECGSDLCRDGQDIPFETFLGFYGDKVPDIDLNFSGDYQSQAHAYTKVLFGDDHVFRAGTIGTVAAKTGLGYVKGYCESTGQNLPQAERERLALGVEGVKRTTGQHPGGIIVIPDYMEVTDFTPIQYPADAIHAEWRTTHFDFHSIDENVLKLDILGHDDPTMIKMLQDLSGIDPLDIPIADSKVMELFQGTEILGVTPQQIYSEVGTYGIPEFGTPFVRGIVEETKPSTFAELLQISGLSHGTDVWLGNAQDLIRDGVVPLAKVIGCRDDIMVTLMQYGLEDQLAFKIMEHVRKGRGIPEDWQAEMRAHGVPDWYIDSCLKIKYMFPKAHASAYVLMALRVAYFKVYYPLYYYAAYFSVRAKEFDLVSFARGKEAVKARIQEIAGKGNEASNKEKELYTELLIANEMLERGYHFDQVHIEKSAARHFIIEEDRLIPPFRAIPGLGTGVADQIVAARHEASFLSKEDLQTRGRVSKSLIDHMTKEGIIDHLPDSDQLTLF